MSSVIPPSSDWMYKRLTSTRAIIPAFTDGVVGFVEYASGCDEYKRNNNTMRCPCEKCKCRKHWKSSDDVAMDLVNYRFMPDYYVWRCHGESDASIAIVTHGSSSHGGQRPEHQSLEQMVVDIAGPSFIFNDMDVDYEGDYGEAPEAEEPNPEFQKLKKMIADARTPLWDPTDESCKSHSKLSASLFALKLKSEYNMPHACFDTLMGEWSASLPKGNRLPKSLYAAKKEVEQLGLGHVEYDVCPAGCMIYYKADIDLEECKFCTAPRYKITQKNGKEERKALKMMWYFPLGSRLQRLFASETTATNMTWHWDYEREDGVMIHPCDSEAWKHFDRVHLDFSKEPRNVRLGLCTNGFNPFGQVGKAYL